MVDFFGEYSEQTACAVDVFGFAVSIDFEWWGVSCGGDGDFVISHIDEAIHSGCETSVFGVVADD